MTKNEFSYAMHILYARAYHKMVRSKGNVLVRTSQALLPAASIQQCNDLDRIPQNSYSVKYGTGEEQDDT